VYAIKSLSKNYIYVGMTNNVERRLSEHNNGENRSTKAYRPFILICSESFPNRVIGKSKGKIFKMWYWKRIPEVC
jgi:putative endonuclease